MLLSMRVEAQTLPRPGDLDRILNNLNEIERFNEEQRKRFFGDRVEPDARPGAGKKQKPSSQSTQQPAQACSPIDKVSISGHEVLGAPPIIYKRLEGKCITVEDLSLLLNDLNLKYQLRGFIATRVYLPEQDLSSKNLEIIVVPGRSSGIEYTDGSTNLGISTAFPTDKEDVIQLRDLEQGLENLNRVQSVEAKFKLYPGEEVGQSIIRIEKKSSKPVHLKARTDNLGTEAVGRYHLTGSVDIDNLFGINDILGVQYTFNLDRDANLTPRFDLERDGHKRSRSLNATYSFSIDYWLLEASGSFSEYNFIVDGVNQDFDIYGKSYSGALSARYLFYRDQFSKMFLTAALEAKRSNSFIEDVEIVSQARRISIGELTLTGDHLFDKHKIIWSIDAGHSVSLLGHRDPLPASIDEHFGYFKGSFSYQTKFFSDKIGYAGYLSAQWSLDGLPGSEKFSIGSFSNVRGFHEDVLVANSGVFLSNTFSANILKNSSLALEVYAGIDIGWINSDNIDSYSQDYLVGSALGMRGKISKYGEFDASYGRALSRPMEFEERKNQFVFNINVTY